MDLIDLVVPGTDDVEGFECSKQFTVDRKPGAEQGDAGQLTFSQTLGGHVENIDHRQGDLGAELPSANVGGDGGYRKKTGTCGGEFANKAREIACHFVDATRLHQRQRG